MSKKTMTISDFMNKYKTFVLGDFKFREPSRKKTEEISEFYKKAYDENIDEFEFYVGFLSELLIEGDKKELKKQMYELPLNQGTLFFFHILENVGIVFPKTPIQK